MTPDSVFFLPTCSAVHKCPAATVMALTPVSDPCDATGSPCGPTAGTSVIWERYLWTTAARVATLPSTSTPVSMHSETRAASVDRRALIESSPPRDSRGREPPAFYMNATRPQARSPSEPAPSPPRQHAATPGSPTQPRVRALCARVSLTPACGDLHSGATAPNGSPQLLEPEAKRESERESELDNLQRHLATAP